MATEWGKRLQRVKVHLKNDVCNSLPNSLDYDASIVQKSYMQYVDIYHY